LPPVWASILTSIDCIIDILRKCILASHISTFIIVYINTLQTLFQGGFHWFFSPKNVLYELKRNTIKSFLRWKNMGKKSFGVALYEVLSIYVLLIKVERWSVFSSCWADSWKAKKMNHVFTDSLYICVFVCILTQGSIINVCRRASAASFKKYIFIFEMLLFFEGIY